MPDAVDEIFAGLDAFYPGSKRKRRDTVAVAKRVAPEESSWEDLGSVKRIHGVEMEMFSVGALAKAVNKSEKSVRLWTTRGYIPQAPYRMPSVEGRDGVTRAGRRLYSKEMIEAAVDAFAKRDLLDSPRIEWKQHPDLTRELVESWREIQNRIAQK